MGTAGFRAAAVVVIAGASASACTAYDRDDYVMSPEKAESYLQLDTAAVARTLPADGFSTTVIRAHIDPSADADKRTLTFTTSAGSLRGGTAAAGGGQQVTVDGSGNAEVELVSATTPGTARVRVTVSNVTSLAREVAVVFIPVVPEDIVRMTVAPADAPADSATLSTFTARIAAGLPADRRRVRFTTTQGVFAGSNQPSIEVDADQSNLATAQVRSPNVSTVARVTASVAGVTAASDIFFRVALPDRILMSPSTATVKGDGSQEAVITVRLLRNVGVPTVNTAVTLRATQGDATGPPIGVFRGFALSNAQGELQVSYSVGVTSYRGRVTIRATVDGASAVGETAIDVINP